MSNNHGFIVYSAQIILNLDWGKGVGLNWIDVFPYTHAEVRSVHVILIEPGTFSLTPGFSERRKLRASFGTAVATAICFKLSGKFYEEINYPIKDWLENWKRCDDHSGGFFRPGRQLAIQTTAASHHDQGH